MVERGWRVMGWILVGLGVGVPVVAVARSVSLVPGPWWVPFMAFFPVAVSRARRAKTRPR